MGTLTLTEPAIVMIHYSLAVTFTKQGGSTGTFDSVGAMMTSLYQRSCSTTTCTADAHGTETELKQGRSSQGYDAQYIGTSTLPADDTLSMATNTAMVMQSLSAGTYTFTVKGKFTVPTQKTLALGHTAHQMGC